MKIRIRYRRARVTVTVPDDFIYKCRLCGKTHGSIGFHHYEYEFKTAEVRKDPQLALKNAIMLCYTHHRLADAIRKVDDNLFDAYTIRKHIAMNKRGEENVQKKKNKNHSEA